MDVVFIRHAAAEPAGEGGDPARRLTDKGKDQSRRTARALAAMGVKIDAILTSPLARAAQTAEIVAAELGTPGPVQTDCLAPPGDVDELSDVLAGLRGEGIETVAVVGHAPSMDELLAHLAVGVDDIGTSLNKAGAACVALPDPHSHDVAELRWLMRRQQLAMIAGGP